MSKLSSSRNGIRNSALPEPSTVCVSPRENKPRGKSSFTVVSYLELDHLWAKSETRLNGVSGSGIVIKDLDGNGESAPTNGHEAGERSELEERFRVQYNRPGNQ